MSGFELIAPLVMNVLPPAIDYFICGTWDDDDDGDETILSTCCAPMTSFADIEDDIVQLEPSTLSSTARDLSSRRSRRLRPMHVSRLSLDDDCLDAETVENSWYCFMA